MKKQVNPTPSIQLNLFSWQTELCAKGWQCLANFDFVAADKTFFSLLRQDADNLVYTEAIKTISYWKEKIEKCNKMEDLETIQFLFSEFNDFNFSNG